MQSHPDWTHWITVGRRWQDVRHWWPGDTPWAIAVTAVLTQHTRWERAWQVWQRLVQAGIHTPDRMAAYPESRLAAMLRPVAAARRKARTLRELARQVRDSGGDLCQWVGTSPDRARDRLLRIHGVGPETADAILLYACAIPMVVVDAYTMRILHRHGVLPAASSRIEEVRAQLARSLPRDVAMLRDFHAYMVMIGRTFCHTRHPNCADCPWQAFLPQGQRPVHATQPRTPDHSGATGPVCRISGGRRSGGDSGSGMGIPKRNPCT